MQYCIGERRKARRLNPLKRTRMPSGYPEIPLHGTAKLCSLLCETVLYLKCSHATYTGDVVGNRLGLFDFAYVHCVQACVDV